MIFKCKQIEGKEGVQLCEFGYVKELKDNDEEAVLLQLVI
jgi:hypothetical protein